MRRQGGTLWAVCAIAAFILSLVGPFAVVPAPAAAATEDCGLPGIDEGFDPDTSPALPSCWTSAGTSGGWSVSDNPVGTVVSTAPGEAGERSLQSPEFLGATGRRVTFRHAFTFESSASNSFDGGVLEISVAGGPYTDIVDAGGSFVTGAYNGTVTSGLGNPLGGRQAWTGGSSFIVTTASLPASAANMKVQLRWRLGTDDGGSSAGWTIDSVRLTCSLDEDFDSVVVPALPSCWTTSATGSDTTDWTTRSQGSASPPNTVFVPSPSSAGEKLLTSPPVLLSGTSRLTWRHRFTFGDYPFNHGVLEVSINGGAFTDISSVGTFSEGGYNADSLVVAVYGKPVWVGASGDFVPVAVELPASLSGSSAAFRWRLASSRGGAAPGDGWDVDSIELHRRGVVSVFRSGRGVGDVTSEDGSIECGSSCSVTTDWGTRIVLTATSDPDSIFTGWSGACSGLEPTCAVVSGPDRAAKATFAVRPTAVDDSIVVGEDSGPNPLQVLNNDSAGDFEKRIVSVSQPSHGTTSIGPDADVVIYEPVAGYCNDEAEPDTFTYQIERGSAATVSVGVACVPDAATSVTLRYVARRRMFRGVVTSDRSTCVTSRQVQIFKTGRTGRVLFAEATAAEDGTFSRIKRARRGSYVAVVPALDLPDVDCLKAESGRVRVR